MKVIKTKCLSAFGGLNFVIEELDRLKIGHLLNNYLPVLGPQSKYSWRDILYSYWSVFFCGGDCAEDLSGNFKPALSQSPFVNTPSPDRILERLKELSEPASYFTTPRGKHPHHFALNDNLAILNLQVLQKLFNISGSKVTVDYDNTYCFTQKQDAQHTYLKQDGYAPGVGFYRIKGGVC